jgi:hypothetical protein
MLSPRETPGEHLAPGGIIHMRASLGSVLVVIAAITFLIVGVGCTSSAPPTAHKQSTSSAPSGSTSAPAPSSSDPQVRAVLQAYAPYWSTLLRDSNPPKPADPALAGVATGTELSRAAGTDGT